MTSYQRGFLIKCAEYGINPYFAGRLLKAAQTASAAGGAQQQQSTVAPQAPKPVTPAVAPPPAPVASTLPKGQGGVQPKPVTQTPTAKTRSQTPAWKQQIQAGIQGLTPEQKQSFTNWYRTGGEVMDDLFRGKDGQIDGNAYAKFINDNPGFLSGTDAFRKQKLQEYYSGLSQEQKAAFKASPTLQKYRQDQSLRQHTNIDRIRNPTAQQKAWNASHWAQIRARRAGVPNQTSVQPPPGSKTGSGLSEQDLAWENMNAEQWNSIYNRSSGNIQPSIDSYHRYQLANPNINTGYNANGQKVRLTGFGPNGRGIWTPVYE